MKVILLEDVVKVGKKDEVVEVSLGYGKNFLIKNKKAVEADKHNLKMLQEKLDEMKKERSQEIEVAKALKKKLEKESFEFKMHVGNKGAVFGKISTKQISTRLKELGYDIDRKKIKTDGINHLGEEKVEVILDKEVHATLNIKIIGE